MDDRDARLLAILRIGHHASMRGAGISMREALHRTGYSELRSSIGPQELLPLIEADRTLVTEWLAYSADKRTGGGWYVLEDRSIGQSSNRHSRISFDTIEEAVANYVIREMDYWAGQRRAGPSK